MSTGQIIFLGLGIVMILSAFDFSSLLKKIEQKANNIDIPDITPAPAPTPITPVDTKDNLVEIVQKWQSFKDATASRWRSAACSVAPSSPCRRARSSTRTVI